tara:strand:- start:2683 stop:3189 length:507 start_codon:yes stop_codon:yes gene_type:complete
MKFRQADEAFDWVLKADGVAAQIDRLKQWAKTNQTAVPLVRWGVGAEKQTWGLPDGEPESIKKQTDIPEGMGDTSIQMEWRRIKAFVDPNGNMQKIVDWKREMNWCQILEGMHHKEAVVLTAVKDGKLLDLYPTLEALLPGLGITEYNKPIPVKKKRATKKKKVTASE